MRGPRLISLSLLGALAVGCSANGDHDTDSSDPAATSRESSSVGTTSSTASPTASSAPSPRSGRRHKPLRSISTGKGSGPWDVVFTDIRVAGHEGFDRVVMEFTGRGRPGWDIYPRSGTPRLEGSGRRVRLAGTAYLDIIARHTTWTPGADYYSGPRRIDPGDDTRLAEVFVDGWFEGDTRVFVGLADPERPLSVRVFTRPTRLVVDIAHGD